MLCVSNNKSDILNIVDRFSVIEPLLHHWVFFDNIFYNLLIKRKADAKCYIYSVCWSTKLESTIYMSTETDDTKTFTINCEWDIIETLERQK